MNDIKKLLSQISEEFHLVDSPFEKALGNEDIEAVKKLIKKGENINSHYTLGLTPLHSAIRFGKSVSFIKDLLELGANPNLPEKREGRTPLYDAAWSENEPLVTILLEYGANPNIADKDKWTPLFCSAWRGHESITEILLTHRANKNAQDIYRKTPLVKAKENGQHGVQNVFKTFINTYPQTYKELVRNIRKGDCEALESTLASGFPVNISNEHGETLLVYAVKERNIDVINILLMYGAKVNRFDFKGFTPLMYAIKTRKKEIIELLLEYGANPSMEAKQGLSAIELAKSNESNEFLEVLNGQVENILTPIEASELWEEIELDRHEVEINSQDLMQGDIIIDRSITDKDVRVEFLFPRSEMGENIVVAVKRFGEDSVIFSRPDIEIPYGKKLYVSRIQNLTFEETVENKKEDIKDVKEIIISELERLETGGIIVISGNQDQECFDTITEFLYSKGERFQVLRSSYLDSFPNSFYLETSLYYMTRSGISVLVIHEVDKIHNQNNLVEFASIAREKKVSLILLSGRKGHNNLNSSDVFWDWVEKSDIKTTELPKF